MLTLLMTGESRSIFKCFPLKGERCARDRGGKGRKMGGRDDGERQLIRWKSPDRMGIGGPKK